MTTSNNPASVQFGSLGKSKAGGGKITPKADVPVNVVMRLDKIEISNDKPGMYNGFDPVTGESVRVRMMTVDEGVAVNMKQGGDAEATKAKLTKQYVGTDAAHRPRPHEVNDPSQKVHCQPGGLLMFTRALKNEDGSYRAHWVETMEKVPGSGCENSMVHIGIDQIRDKEDRKKVIGTNVTADIVYTEKAVMLNTDNVLPVLQASFANVDADGIKRRPFVSLRLIEAATGTILLRPARASAKYVETTRKDFDSGIEHTNYDADTAEQSIARLVTADVGKGDEALIVRGAMWALTGQEGYPDLSDIENPDAVGDVQQIVDAVRSGVIVVEGIPGERMSAGPATRASIIKASEANPKNPMNWYAKRNENGFVTERRFVETFLTTAVGKDGYRYFSKALMADCYPKPLPLEKIATINDKTGVVAEAQARVAEQEAGVDEAAAPFNPGALDELPAAAIDEKLAASASTIDNLEM
jgi:hypothetical protein